MSEYIIDPDNRRIVKGPSPAGVLHTTAIGRKVVPEIKPAIDPDTEKYGPPEVHPDRVEWPVLPLTADEINTRREELVNEIRMQCQAHITMTLGWNVERQLNVRGGIYAAGLTPYLDAAVALSISESNRLEDAIAAAATLTAARALANTAAWPRLAEGAYSYEEAKGALP